MQETGGLRQAGVSQAVHIMQDLATERAQKDDLQEGLEAKTGEVAAVTGELQDERRLRVIAERKVRTSLILFSLAERSPFLRSRSCTGATVKANQRVCCIAVGSIQSKKSVLLCAN